MANLQLPHALIPVIRAGADEVVRLAELQRGLIHRRQLLAAGVGARQIDHRVESRQLTRVRREVYALGPFVPTGALANETAVAMQFDGRGVLSHRTAALVWGLTDLEPDLVEVTLVGRNGGVKRSDGVRMHTVPSLHHSEARRHQGLPVTSPARTWVDLAGECSELELASALAIGRRHNLLRDSQIRAVIERLPRNRPGLRTARELFESDEDPAETRSKWERQVLALFADAELPKPLTNVYVEGRMVDYYWPDQRLVIEFDSRAHHQDDAAFETDRERDQWLSAGGNRVQRLTASQVRYKPLALAARVSAALRWQPPS